MNNCPHCTQGYVQDAGFAECNHCNKKETNMNIRPLGKSIIAKELPREERSKGGIYIPQETREKQQYYHKVIAVGPDVVEVKPGDTIYAPADARRNTVDLGGERAFRFHEPEIPFIYEP